MREGQGLAGPHTKLPKHVQDAKERDQYAVFDRH